jgi:hypothetical protein
MREVRKMMAAVVKKVSTIIVIALLLAGSSCSTGKYFKTERIAEAGISGVFTLILYGRGDQKRIAIFDIEGDEYTFEVYGSEFNYTLKKGVSADRALAEGKGFIASHRSRMRRILDDNGNAAGYELRPLYDLFRYGTADILDVNYRVIDKQVRVTVEVKRSVRNLYYRDLFRGE